MFMYRCWNEHIAQLVSDLGRRVEQLLAHRIMRCEPQPNRLEVWRIAPPADQAINLKV